MTGGAGCLGRSVVRQLLGRGAKVFVPRSHEFDLRNAGHVSRLYDAARPQIVIHLAATVGGIGITQEKPGTFFYNNTIMGLHVIEEARRHALDKIVVIGSVCAYPKLAPIPLVEETLWDGYPEKSNASYGMAKRMLLVQCHSYRQEYGLNCIYLLPTNLYGPHDNFCARSSHVIPGMIRKFTEAVKQHANRVTLWGSGEVSREFLYVDDCADAIVLATEFYDLPEPVNIGSGQEIRIRDLAVLIAQLVGFKGEVVWDLSQPDGQPRRRLDTSRAEQCFGFRAQTSLRDGLQRTLDWWNAQTLELAMSIPSRDKM